MSATTDEFQPSSIVLHVPPLTDTMRKSEVESAAGLLVWALSQSGDTWRPLPAKEFGALLKRAMDEKTEPIATWGRNPFLRPDFALLVEYGFAERAGEAPNQTLAFTEAGLAALRPYAAKQGSP